MAEVSREEAISRARQELGVVPSTGAQAWRVGRLDRPDAAYYLVVFGGERTATGVATVDALRGEVGVSARLPGRGPHLAVDAGRAADLAGLGTGAQVDLVWQPCRASRSPLYPLWRVRMGGRTIYVDQQGGVWRELEPGGPGG
jgi:hypothetical protein